MRTVANLMTLTVGLALPMMMAGCDQGTTKTEKPDSAKAAPPTAPPTAPASSPGMTTANQAPSNAEMPAGHPPANNLHAKAAQPSLEGNTLKLDGVTMTVPDGWQPGPKPTGPMAAKFVFVLPKADGDTEDGAVRISHFPGMQGKDDMNISRWISQTTKPDGSPNTREDAKIETKTFKGGSETIVSLSGSVRATMRSKPLADAKMIAAIINHANGPHFVVVSGPAKTIDKWSASIDQFLGSAVAE